MTRFERIAKRASKRSQVNRLFFHSDGARLQVLGRERA